MSGEPDEKPHPGTSDHPASVGGHEDLGAFNMDLELRNKIEGEARDAKKLADDAERKLAAVQSDHDSNKAALDAERKITEGVRAELAGAQAALAKESATAVDLQIKLSAAETELAELRAAAAKANEPPPAPAPIEPPPPAPAPQETNYGDEAAPQGSQPAA